MMSGTASLMDSMIKNDKIDYLQILTNGKKLKLSYVIYLKVYIA